MNTDLTWTKAKVTRADRWNLLGQSGVVVWLTGLSGSGKSTLAVALDNWLHQHGRHCQILDGDNLRQGLCRGLTFTEADRTENIRRAGEAAKLLAESGLIVICSLISPYAKLRQETKLSCQAAGLTFLEVFVNAPMEVCEQRDPRGLYRKARAGKIHEFTGITSPYELPEHPDLELPTDRLPLEQCLNQLTSLVMKAAKL
ncbi:MAG: adenylyl-sulfate kinase [Prosthecobacter sp.]|nr:adenylyl-sulfate kinase [Prosthecobacter sp.]